VLVSGLKLLMSNLDEAALERTGGVPTEPLPDPTLSRGVGMIGTGVEPLVSLIVMLPPLARVNAWPVSSRCRRNASWSTVPPAGFGVDLVNFTTVDGGFGCFKVILGFLGMTPNPSSSALNHSYRTVSLCMTIGYD
jgi:hypothetical protein